MFKKLCMKPLISLFLTMVLLLSFTIPTYATETFSSGEISSKICAKIIDALDFVSLEKDLYGLADVDFDAISVGNPIHAYEYANERLIELGFTLYPLTNDGNLVAFAAKDNETSSIQISTALVDEISSYITSNDSFAIIYDINNCYIYTSNGLKQLHTVNIKVDGRGILDTNTGKSVLTELKLNPYSAIQSVGYNSSDKTSPAGIQSNYESVNVSFVTQNPPSKYCWASCIACIGNYKTNLSYSGEYVARYWFGDNFDQGLNAPDAFAALNAIYSVKYRFTDNVPSDDTILGEILAGYPLFSGWTYSGGAHACVICGINAIAGYITVMDPEYDFCSASTNGSTYYFYSLYNGLKMTLHDYGSSIR